MDDLVNKRVRALAADHGLTVPETLAALDKHPIELDRDQFLRRTLALELIELDQLQQAFRDKALEDRDVGSGLLLLKVAERRATLLGMNAPQGHAVQIIQHEPAADAQIAGLRSQRSSMMLSLARCAAIVSTNARMQRGQRCNDRRKSHGRKCL